MTQDPKLLALGLAGGYLLGRTRKAKLALAVASYVVGRRKGINPQQLLTEGLKKLSDTPEFARLNEQVRGELMSAGRSMVTAAANRRMDSLADALHERTDALSASDEDEEPDEEPEEEPEEEEPEEEEPEEELDEEEDEEPDEEEEEEEEPEEKPAARKAPSKKAPPKKASPKKTAKKPPPKKAAAEKPAAKKSSSKTAATKKTAAKKTASRSTRRR